MYHTGGDRGWHHGHHPREIHPPRNHHSRPYRGGYHEHRDHDSYGSYHENQCHDRSFNDYSDHSYPEYYEEKQPFNEYREHREPVYNRGARHDSGYHKETYYRGGYQRGRGEPARYRGNVPETAPYNKYCNKPAKAHKKENEIRVKTSTSQPQPAEKVIHNSGRIIVTLTPGSTEDASETKSSKMKSPEQPTKPSQDCDKPSQETVKLECVKKDDVKVDSVVKEITPPSEHTNEILPACNIKTEITEVKMEDTLQSVKSIEKEALPMRVNPGKRAFSEERDVGVEQREEKSVAGKRQCSIQDRDENDLEKTVQIPFLL